MVVLLNFLKLQKYSMPIKAILHKMIIGIYFTLNVSGSLTWSTTETKIEKPNETQIKETKLSGFLSFQDCTRDLHPLHLLIS